MKRNAFVENFWLFNSLIGIVFGIWIAIEFQLLADSNEYILSKIITASLIGAFSYGLALILGILKNFRRFRVGFRFRFLVSHQTVSFIFISIISIIPLFLIF
jgi:hypothetical protein